MPLPNIKVEAIKSTNYLFCKTGIINEYRRAFYDMRGGSTKEITWDRKNHKHMCCGSKVSWRHRVACKGLQGNEKWKELEREEEEYYKKNGQKIL